MTYFKRLFLCLAVLLHVHSAWGQPAPRDLQLGADFLWFLAQSAKPQDAYTFKQATLPRDKALEAQIKAAHATLAPMRAELVPEVDVIEQYYLERGEQMTVFRVQSNRRGSRFFELHILGATRPPRIIGIKELQANTVVQRLAAKHMLTLRPSK